MKIRTLLPIIAIAALSLSLGGCSEKYASVPSVGMQSLPFAPLRHGEDYEVIGIKTGEQCDWILFPFLLKPIYTLLQGASPYELLRIEALNQVIDSESTAVLPMSFAAHSTNYFVIETYCGKVQAAAIKFKK